VPKRVEPGDRRSHQLLLRLTGDEFDVLDAAAHLNRVTPNSYAYDLLRTHIERLATDEFIKNDLQNRQEFAQAQASTVPLRSSAGVDAEAVPQADGAT